MTNQQPSGGLMDPNFRYVRAEQTDIRLTFARIRAQQRERTSLLRLPAPTAGVRS